MPLVAPYAYYGETHQGGVVPGQECFACGYAACGLINEGVNPNVRFVNISTLDHEHWCRCSVKIANSLRSPITSISVTVNRQLVEISTTFKTGNRVHFSTRYFKQILLVCSDTIRNWRS